MMEVSGLPENIVGSKLLYNSLSSGHTSKLSPEEEHG